MNTTMGQAVDEAVRQHRELHPGSEVYGAEVAYSRNRDGHWWVELQAEHFSTRLTYYVPLCKPAAG